MSNLPTFMAYAAAFEQTFADDNWQRLEPFFAEDATYEVTGIPGGGVMHGRDAIFRGIKKSLDGFDRRMASRQIVPTAPPSESGDRVTLQGLVRYVRDGAPVEMHATIVVEFADGKIVRMHDTFALDAAAMAWLQRNAHDLDGSYL
jgi:ketosteroid isomerase-like protein